ncbi:Ribose/Galactose Isomerase [Streptococcus anginosus]|uniref:RpiB/LacA/LacB family sugar-phosphate isomerase n=1 Tax=Streptococcus TaxID=1301 RepID=UPI00086CBA69|nr:MULTISPECIES: RpiB/LacA/LacB family sugar-phosphate isomerase [Streptococcus]KAA9317662.1 sugar phosphate isomerase [Streptococcus anginosus]MCW1027097.1 RpiB/LacA/LacB family sugar-phosphate isomerase [Streptococcus anginosus]MCW1050249.1 RpiB/LacA/LacB family sugar-phosphate isomerase [Streptococcus anginosus]OFP79267.1 sugar phosphate isomerase [Streptococcus sp. HMSC056D07]SCQ07380.1 Ribose/Galactose Isomerase [Streptococcus anginosus]
MRVAVIQGTTRRNMNLLLFESVKKAVQSSDEVLNFGIFEEENEQYSYVEIAILISFLMESGAVDFVVTGCSSGQGMMLACNSLPDLLCGYIENPQDAFLFGRINGGNVASLPLDLNFGWQGELNLQYTLDKLFDGEFGMGYPEHEAEIKRLEASALKNLNRLTKRSWEELLDQSPKDNLNKLLQRKIVMNAIINKGSNKEFIRLLKAKADKMDADRKWNKV